MKNWKKVILGVVLSFMILFVGIGYAALTDTLFISGDLFATTPNDIFISNIVPVGDTQGVTATQSDLRQITVSGSKGATARFAITVCNNTDSRYVYTGSSANPDSITVEERNTADGPVLVETKDNGTYVYSEEPEKKESVNFLEIDRKMTDRPTTVTFYVKYTLTGDGPIVIDYNFQEFIYKIAYVHNEVERDVWYVHEGTTITIINDKLATKLRDEVREKHNDEKIEFVYWMNSGSKMVDVVLPENKEDIELYPKFNPLYTAMFVDQDGNILDWMMFSTSQKDDLLNKAEDTISKVPNVKDGEFDYWVVQAKNADSSLTTKKLEEYTSVTTLPANDITIYPVYLYKGDVNLIPIDSDGDGDTDYYQVGGYSDPSGQDLVEIPAVFNGIKVTEINQNAFASYDGVHSALIPSTITSIDANAFAAVTSGSGETVTLYYQGSRTDWQNKEINFTDGWDDGLGKSSRIFFLDKYGKVDTTQGYLQASGSVNSLTWSEKIIDSGIVNEYTGYCDCSRSTTGDIAHTYVDANGNVMGRDEDGTPLGNNGKIIERKWVWSQFATVLTDGNTHTYKRYRPDAAYWEGVTVS